MPNGVAGFLIMRKAILILSLLASLFSFGQDEEQTALHIADSIDGVYIPKDLFDTFNQINSIWPDSTKVKMKTLTEEKFLGNHHFGLGLWMRNNWGLWGGSRLSRYFNEKGIFHPDDMSGIILTSYHRHMNNLEIELEKQIKYYQHYWKEAEEKELKRKTDEFSLYKAGDTVTFAHPYGFTTKEQEQKYSNGICYAHGKILQVDTKRLYIKVKLIDACDKKGIIIEDNKDSEFIDPEFKKRVIKYLKKKQEYWFYYSNWETD